MNTTNTGQPFEKSPTLQNMKFPIIIEFEKGGHTLKNSGQLNIPSSLWEKFELFNLETFKQYKIKVVIDE